MKTDGQRALQVFVEDRGSHLEVAVAGSITESSELSSRQIEGGRPVILDVGEVASINSMGIRTWYNFLAGLCSIASEVKLRRLPPNMVSQASMVKNFLATAEVESFYAPYCCEECGCERLELIPSFAELPESVPCTECSESMIFDDLRESYLAFRTDAEQADTIPADSPVHLLLDQTRDETVPPFSN